MSGEAGSQAPPPPFVTVVMPVRNEEAFIERILGELVDQDYPADRYEVIVADGESTDRTRELVAAVGRKHPQVRLHANPGRLSSAGRNVGFRAGRGDLFVVVDGHCELRTRSFLRNVADCFRESEADCLARPQPFVTPAEPTMERAIALARSSRMGHSTTSNIHSGAEGVVSAASSGCAYRRDVFDRVGYVDEQFDACEDVEFNHRLDQAGLRAFTSPRVAVHYFPRKDLRGLWRQLQRYGQGRAQFLRKHPRALDVNMLIPVAFAAGVVAGPFAGFIHPVLWAVYGAVMLLYLVIIGIESVRLARGDPAFAATLMAAFFTIHFGLGTGLVVGAWRLWRRDAFTRGPD